MSNNSTVSKWRIPLADKVHTVEFEHGTTSGKRVIIIDDEVVRREDYMFKLVGTEHFRVGWCSCELDISPSRGLNYDYLLTVNGKVLDKFVEAQSRSLRCWRPTGSDNIQYTVILEKDSMDIHIDGIKVETTGEFTDFGTVTHFSIGELPAVIETVSSGNKSMGMLHNLIFNSQPVVETNLQHLA